MRLWYVFALLGRIAQYFSFFFIIPALFALYDSNWKDSIPFFCGGLVSFGMGKIFSLPLQKGTIIQRPEAMLFVSGSWLLLAIFSAIPYVIIGLPFVDALFESMSGLTTTGATILTDFSAYNRSFFLWRALTQWLGGLGVIALFVIILPMIGVSGRQMMFAEGSSAPSEELSPSASRNATSLWRLYSALTLICFISLHFAGMGYYDSLVHAFTTLSAGGFSPYGGSILDAHSSSVEWILIFFMFLAGASFPLQLKVFSGNWRTGWFDGELRMYTAAILVCSLFLAFLLTFELGGTLFEHFRMALFQIVSVLTSTGFASVDYNLWSDQCKVVIVIAMLISGCAGSAGGGPKSIRILLSFRHILRELKQALYPKAVFALRYKEKVIPDVLLRSIYNLVILYFAGYLLVGFALALSGLDMVTAFSASLACLGNVGPGFNELGPMGNFSSLSDFAKLLLVAAMWIGRLEVVSVIALFLPLAWRGVQWKQEQEREKKSRFVKIRDRFSHKKNHAQDNSEETKKSIE